MYSQLNPGPKKAVEEDQDDDLRDILGEVEKA